MSALEQRLVEGMKLFVNAYASAAQTIVRTIGDAARNAGALVRAAVNDPVHVSGLEARFYVRAGADPAYVNLTAVDQLVREILDGRAEGTRLLNGQNRRLVAVAAMRGWVVHR